MHSSVYFDRAGAANARDADEVSFPCNSRALLRVLESTLERQYQNIFSSIAQFRAANLMNDAHALVIRRAGAVSSVFLYRIENGRAIIMNETIRIDGDDMLRAVRHIFDTSKSVSVICWRAIQTDIQRLPFPFQRFNYSEDIVVPLPPTEADYLASLGKATRKNLLRHRNRLRRDHPDFHYEVHTGEAIEERHIRQLVEFNRARMSGKNKPCGFHEQEVQRLIALARTHGMVLVVAIGDRICAGSICLRVGENYFMEIGAHDPAYDSYRMGTLCCYLSICEAIARGGRELHLLWGRDEYKYMLLGQQHDLDNVLIYRSRMHMLINGGLALRSALQGLRRKAKLNLYRVAARDASASRLARSALEILRNLKGFVVRRA